MSAPDRVVLAHHTVRTARRVPVGTTGTVQRAAADHIHSPRGSGALAFVRWDNGDRSWHPTGALTYLDAGLRRSMAA